MISVAFERALFLAVNVGAKYSCSESSPWCSAAHGRLAPANPQPGFIPASLAGTHRGAAAIYVQKTFGKLQKCFLLQCAALPGAVRVRVQPGVLPCSARTGVTLIRGILPLKTKTPTWNFN